MKTNPVRKIGNSHGGAIRGLVPSPKNGRQINVESALERDFSILLEFDINVENYVEQPITLEYVLDGKKRKYTPDFLIKYIDTNTKPVLAEIKYRKDIRENWDKLKPKFKAAKEKAEERGWALKIFTEIEIRNIYLENIKFLMQFRKKSNLPNHVLQDVILNIVSSVKETTPDEVLLIAFNDKNRQAELLPTLWYTISTGLIGCNLFQKLTMKTPIWSILD